MEARRAENSVRLKKKKKSTQNFKTDRVSEPAPLKTGVIIITNTTAQLMLYLTNLTKRFLHYKTSVLIDASGGLKT